MVRCRYENNIQFFAVLLKELAPIGISLSAFPSLLLQYSTPLLTIHIRKGDAVQSSFMSSLGMGRSPPSNRNKTDLQLIVQSTSAKNTGETQ